MRPFDFMPNSYSRLSRDQRDEILSRTLDQVGLTDEAQADLGATRGAALTIYTTPACQGCKLTKTKLAEAGVEFTAVDLSERPDLVAQFKAQGLLAAPIIETPDGERTAGFRPDRIKSIIATASTSLHATPTHTPEVNGDTVHRPKQSRGRTL